MKENWQDFYEKKKKKESRGAREGRGVVCYLSIYMLGIGKAESSSGGGGGGG